MLNTCFRFILTIALIVASWTVRSQECGIIYVSPTGATSGVTGTRNNPAELQHAFTLVDAANNHMRLAHGVYELTETLELPSDLVFEGGFEEGSWYKTNADSTIPNGVSPNRLNIRSDKEP